MGPTVIFWRGRRNIKLFWGMEWEFPFQMEQRGKRKEEEGGQNVGGITTFFAQKFRPCQKVLRQEELFSRRIAFF